MTTAAGRLDRRFGARVLVAVPFVAFDAAGLVRFALAVRDAVISVLYAKAAAFIRGVRVVRAFVTSEALQHLFRAGVLIGVVTILAPFRVFRLRMIPVIENFDDAPFGMLPPL